MSEFLPLLEQLEALWDCEEWSRMVWCYRRTSDPTAKVVLISCWNSIFYVDRLKHYGIVKNEAEWYGATAAPVTQRPRSYSFRAETQSSMWTLSSWNLISLPPNQFSQRKFKVVVFVVVVSRRPSRSISISIASLTPTPLPLPWHEENINVANSQPRDCLAPSKYIPRDIFMKMVVTGTVNWGRLCKGAHET
jgi:hypothetical protein